MRPLYNSDNLPSRRPQAAHYGLWYDKYCNTWKSNWTDGLGEDGKKTWINTVVGHVGQKQALEETSQRLAILLESAGQNPHFYKTSSNFVTGLGREHPVENGFAWHHSLGVPYLPSSSIKGMVRSWASKWAKGVNRQDIEEIFGLSAGVLSQNRETNSRVGKVIILDALPIRSVQLKADIMTPHYGEYYSSEGNNITPPADYLSPTPIPFLVVSKGCTFQFGVLPRCKDEASICRQVLSWLEQALIHLGFGAKTSVGYGHFEQDNNAKNHYLHDKKERTEASKKLEFEKSMEGRSSIYKELADASLLVDKDAFSRRVVDWLGQLEANPDVEVIQLLDELMKHHYPKPYKNPEAAKKPNQREWILRLRTLKGK